MNILIMSYIISCHSFVLQNPLLNSSTNRKNKKMKTKTDMQTNTQTHTHIYHGRQSGRQRERDRWSGLHVERQKEQERG